MFFFFNGLDEQYLFRHIIPYITGADWIAFEFILSERTALKYVATLFLEMSPPAVACLGVGGIRLIIV